MDKQQTELHQFRTASSCDGDLSPCKVRIRLDTRFRVRVWKQKFRRINGQKNGQTNGRDYTNFEKNLAVMVIYVPVKFEFDWKKRF